MLAIEIPQYQYQSGIVARHTAHALDMHYGSELFGSRYHGPAVAIVGAIGTISAGASIGGLLGGIMIAGGIASGLGGLTGNKTLSTIGMGLGLASLGASGFVGADGSFMNPFSEGYKFADTQMGMGFSKIKDFLTGSSANTSAAPSLADKLSTNGNDIIDAAKTNGLPSSATNDMGYSLANSSPTETIVGTQNVRDVASSAASSGGKGLLNSIGGTRDIMALAGGLAQGYQQGQAIDQKQPLVDANVEQMNAQTQLLQDRYNNMQAQPGVNIGVNSNAEIFNKTNNQGKFAVIVDGKVQYITAEQYAQLKQAQQQPQGLLANPGATT